MDRVEEGFQSVLSIRSLIRSLIVKTVWSLLQWTKEREVRSQSQGEGIHEGIH